MGCFEGTVGKGDATCAGGPALPDVRLKTDGVEEG